MEKAKESRRLLNVAHQYYMASSRMNAMGAKFEDMAKKLMYKELKSQPTAGNC